MSARFATRRLIIAAGAVFIAAIVASAAFDIMRLHRQTLAANDRELSNLANAIAEQTARTFQTLDVLLRDTVTWYDTGGARLPPAELQEALKTRLAGLPQVRALSITDANGMQRHSSRTPDTSPVDLSDRSFFLAQREDPKAGLIISDPFTSRVDGQLAVGTSRPIIGPRGEFAGVLVATTDIDYFQQFYGALDLGAGSSISLLRRDGTLLARFPRMPEKLGQRFAQLPPLADNATGSAETIIESPIDGARRVLAASAVRGFPLVVTVSREERVALAPWREQAINIVVRTATLALLAALLIVAFTRQLARLEAADASLRESEERYALAMTGSNEGHWDWDLVTDRLFLSPRMRELHGLPAALRVSTRAELFQHAPVHPDDWPRFEATAQDHIAGRTPRLELEYRVVQPDRSIRWLQSRGQAFRDRAGRAVRMAGSANDITDRKRAEADKLALEGALRRSQKMEAMGTLAGGIAHDFNNILGAILGYGEMAAKSATPGSPARRYIDNVMNAGNRAKSLVERILAFSRTGLGERVPVHVESVVRETLDLLRPSLPAGVTVAAQLTSGDACVIGDPTQIYQVVLNLATNAVQAMPESGTLGIVLERVELAEARGTTHGPLAPGRYIRIAVSDTGTGIAPEVMERIFDPFFTTKGVGEGTGLGLSLVHGIVTDLGGGVDVQAQPGNGTRFDIYLPMSDQVAAAPGKAVGDVPHGRGETVLIVDDDRTLVMLCEEMLAELGYEAVGFESSVAALAALRAAPDRFDAVLADETMPAMTGTELAVRIRELRPDLPVIVMSGYGGATLAARASAAGVRKLLRKPLAAREIAEALAAAFSASRAGAAPAAGGRTTGEADQAATRSSAA